MANFCIGFELRKGKKQEYGDLLAGLEWFKDRCHPLEFMWFISTPWTSRQVYAHLRRFLDPDDDLLVEELPVGQGWSGWVRQDVQEWLTEHLGPPC